jgi:hypothetical protein
VAHRIKELQVAPKIRRRFCALYKSRVIVLVIVLTTVGCAKNGSSDSSGPAANSSSPALTEAEMSSSIKGVVRLDGIGPVLKPIDMSAAPACVQANPTAVIPPQVMTGEHGTLAGVAVYVKSGLGSHHFDTPQDPIVLEQKACVYEPHVIALMVNQKLEVRNKDATTHNVHVLSKTNQPWNKSQPTAGPAMEVSFPQPELAIPVICNVHPWMRAFAFVFDHPYYAVTSQTGVFELQNLPPGRYTIEAWQEKYGTQEQTVTLGPKESKTISFTFKSDRPTAD